MVSLPHTYAELQLRKTLSDEGVQDGDTLLLIDDKEAAKEKKEEARKRKLLAIHQKKVLLALTSSHL